MTRKLSRPVLWIAYLLVLCAGITSAIAPPKSLEGFPYVWASLSVLGGAFGAWAVYKGAWRVERWAAPLALGGIGSYAITIWLAVFAETPTRLTQAFIVSIAVMLLLDRTIYLARKAGQIRDALRLIKK